MTGDRSDTSTHPHIHTSLPPHFHTYAPRERLLNWPLLDPHSLHDRFMAHERRVHHARRFPRKGHNLVGNVHALKHVPKCRIVSVEDASLARIIANHDKELAAPGIG